MDSPHLRNGIQQFMGEAHEAACCALCLIDVAQEFRDAHGQGSIDVMEALYKACGKGYIYLNWKNLNDNDNFYVPECLADDRIQTPGNVLLNIVSGNQN